ncbi:hypothetical protein NO995_07505 [Aestuariibaculum sp. M13]|uniref:hypothetical protein n=1 Tax=unclassified Aestuariibaculum TaxID=2646735 RepID=UPI002159CC84|nr:MULTISPECIES: hypothetical protein [unclassified Aestuariibaculum]MCR8667521.1 hypothetical protein [Aestuariibaculum sp. M13]WMI65243.1 hypothetical protein RBH94_14400 [Aestuariibaculum sp. YM273]
MKKNWLDIILFLGVALMITVSAVIFIKTYEKKEIIEEGIQVEAEVLESPNSCDNLGRRPPYSKIKYLNKIFIKKTGNDICHLVSQQKYVTVYSNKSGDEIIFFEEYNSMQFVYAIGIFLIAIGIIIKKIIERN